MKVRAGSSVQQESRMRLGFPELLVILFIVLLIFGANRLPDLAKGVGKSIKNFKDAVKEGEDQKKS
jgi:sec-independent protein translocase protein TatA